MHRMQLNMKNGLQLHRTFRTASDAFDWLYPTVNAFGADFDGTRALFNIGFIIDDPTDRHIRAPYRKFIEDYAEAEWQWYFSGDRSIEKLGEIYGKIPQIWTEMADWRGNVNSNYGWQWDRNDQLDKVVQMLQENPNTRKAAISIYDGKEIDQYRKDTPCTYAVQFTIFAGKLHMAVHMRSNDVWFGFCNDQYCFSKMQEMVADRVGVPIGTYYHHAHNMHIYERHFDLNNN